MFGGDSIIDQDETYIKATKKTECDSDCDLHSDLEEFEDGHEEYFNDFQFEVKRTKIEAIERLLFYINTKMKDGKNAKDKAKPAKSSKSPGPKVKA